MVRGWVFRGSVLKRRNYVCQALIESKIIAKNKNQKEIKFEKKIGSLTRSFHGSCDFKQFRRGRPKIGMGRVATRKNILIISYTKSCLKNRVHAASFFCQFHYFFKSLYAWVFQTFLIIQKYVHGMFFLRDLYLVLIRAERKQKPQTMKTLMVFSYSP